MTLRPLLAVLFAVLLALPALAAEPHAPFEQAVQPYLTAHCTRCHNEQKMKGEFRVDNLARDFGAGAASVRWGDVIDRITSAEMPPPKEPQPTAEESAKIVEWLAARLKEGERARMAKRDRVTFHKLTREEYANTVYDLLGVHYDAADPTGLPEDPNWQGFERIGSVLSLSPAHVEKYFAAAEAILAEALPSRPPEKFYLKWDALTLRGGGDRKKLAAEGLLDKVRVDVWPGSTFQGQPGAVSHVKVPASGEYVVRVKLSGMKPPNGRAPRLAIYLVDADRMLYEQDVVTTESEPVTVEFRAHLSAGPRVLRMTNEAPGPSNLPRAGRNGGKLFTTIAAGRNPWQTKLTDEAGVPILPFLIVDHVEFEGPILESYPTRAQWAYLPQSKGDLTEARDVVARFATKAFRRPARADEVDRLMTLVDRELKAGEKFDAAVRTALLAVLCSKDFFYLVEGSPDRQADRVTDHELASRLSYFLWSTMPDDELLSLAAAGTLHKPDVLRQQVARMLKDERIARFSDGFARQWLQLRRVGMFPPDKKLYPTYDDHLQKSMVGETTAYFAEVLTKNLSLREFLDSDWTTMNARLAEHYGVPGVTGDDYRRVPLPPASGRGGILTHASVLSLTSDGIRHRPVHRGKWVLESIVGKPPPPPPANVKPIEPTPANDPKATLRMKLAAHLSDANCASCHAKIDPLGLAFDNFDAIGRWRTEEVVADGQGANPKVDASGQLPDGRTFTDAAGLRKLLVEDLDKFNAAFVEKLATYALRRPMTIDDRDALHALAKASKQKDYRLQSIVEILVTSEMFRKR